MTLPNGVITDYTYDAASRLTGQTYRVGQTTLGNLTYTYDSAGQRTQLGGTWSRTGLPQAVASATYNAANHQLTFGGQTLTYDLNGNLTSDGTTTYTWDARNRLASLSGGGTSASFQYDPLGRRAQKIVNGILTDFLYDGVNPVQELSGASVIANLLTGLGIDEYFTRTDSAGTRALLADALGSTWALTDPAGSVQTEYTYEPFGAAAVSGDTNGNPFQYTGRENDGTGLYYFRARYYAATLGRFVSEDPIRFWGGDNLYRYVRNNPLRYWDPYGWAPGDPYPTPDAAARAGICEQLQTSVLTQHEVGAPIYQLPDRNYTYGDYQWGTATEISPFYYTPGRDIGFWHTHPLPSVPERFSDRDIRFLGAMGGQHMYVGTYSGKVLKYDPNQSERKKGMQIDNCPPFEGRTPTAP